jgi:hypothetical protein
MGITALDCLTNLKVKEQNLSANLLLRKEEEGEQNYKYVTAKGDVGVQYRVSG